MERLPTADSAVDGDVLWLLLQHPATLTDLLTERSWLNENGVHHADEIVARTFREALRDTVVCKRLEAEWEFVG